VSALSACIVAVVTLAAMLPLLARWGTPPEELTPAERSWMRYP
jgi:hypothetical protein